MSSEATETALASITTLNQLLAAENAALSGMDIPAANRLLAEKTRATEALTAALRRKPALPEAARAQVGRLMALSQENKALLERAMAAQKRVIACIARAVPRALGEASPYAANGRTPPPRAMPPISLSANA